MRFYLAAYSRYSITARAGWHLRPSLSAERLAFMPEPHPLGCLMRDNVQWMKRHQPIALLKHIVLSRDRRGPPGKCRREGLTGCDAQGRAVVVVLRGAQPRENVAAVVGIRMSGFSL